jgi:ATP-dependent HslUV protease subunit HslV
MESSDKKASDIARRAIEIAADICIYTDKEITVEVIGE